MILVGGVDSQHITSLNGLGVLQPQSGHWVNPMAWREGIHGLGDLPLSPGLHGLGSAAGTIDFASADWSLQGSALKTIAPSLGVTIPNWVVYAGIALLVFKNR